MTKKYAVIAMLILGFLIAGTTTLAAELTRAEGRRAQPRAAVSSTPLAQVSAGSTGTPAATAVPAVRIDLEAFLTGGAAHPTLAGKADYEVERDGDREFEVSVRGASALAGQTLDVYVDGVLVGHLTVNRDGRGRLELDSGHGHDVPFVTEGSLVELRLAGAVVAGGNFVPDVDDDGLPPGAGPTGTPAATAVPAIRIDLEAPLSGGTAHPALVGKADYEVERDGDREFEVGVRGATALVGQTLDVYVDGVLVGHLTVNSDGRGRLELDSGHGHDVPFVTEGSVVELRLGGAVVVGGAFVPDIDDDDIDDIDDDDDDDIDDDDDDDHDDDDHDDDDHDDDDHDDDDHDDDDHDDDDHDDDDHDDDDYDDD